MRRLFPASVILLLLALSPILYAQDLPQRDTSLQAKIAEWQRAAGQGDADAQCRLGKLYSDGVEVEADLEQAFYWFTKAAEGGSIDAAAALSTYYCFGRGVVSVDYTEAARWCRIAAEAGHSGAQNRMGWLYESGYGGLEKSYEEAMKWYKLGADNGSSMALANIGNLYKNGWGVEQDYETALSYIQKAVDRDNSFAFYLMGIMYEFGFAVGPSPEEAYKWYLKGAEAEEGRAQEKVAYFMRNGKGCKKDLKGAAEWYRKAIQNGQENDYYPLGTLLYEMGDYFEAVTCFQEAHLRNYRGAATFLGYCYEKGHGVPLSLYQALSLYQEDADAGHAEAYYYLGRMYEKSEVHSMKEAKANLKKIQACYETGAGLGSKKAQRRLNELKTTGVTIRFVNKNGFEVTYNTTL